MPAWARHALAFPRGPSTGSTWLRPQVSRKSAGLRVAEREQETAIGMELLMVTTNILSISLVLQYVIRDPADFLRMSRTQGR